MKTILVTGANGFIGSHTINWLTQRAAQNSELNIIAACRDRAKLAPGFEGEVREGDLRDKAYLHTLLNGVDGVVNCMAWSSLWGHKPLSDRLYFQPVQQLIEQFFSSEASRFVNVSSSSAASPEHSQDASSPGIPHPFWPHMCNVINIENLLRQRQQQQTDKTIVNMRLGIFAGESYGLGLLPVLIPRLKTHLVPWVAGGYTDLPIVDGRDLGQSLGLAALTADLHGYQAFNITGPQVPTVREVILFLNKEYGYPRPHFSVPFSVAYPFAWLMEKFDVIVPWEPLIVRSIVHLLEETGSNNLHAEKLLGYRPVHDWRDAIRVQVAEMNKKQTRPMSMARPVTD
ncbi:MAG TPA: NAD(P)-dependent oxidoreductase [Gammaproteobacteria bacterium]|nr:NAD(P)-dependent oxidoreductase [Gammaproteobacteria bacterium]